MRHWHTHHTPHTILIWSIRIAQRLPSAQSAIIIRNSIKVDCLLAPLLCLTVVLLRPDTKQSYWLYHHLCRCRMFYRFCRGRVPPPPTTGNSLSPGSPMSSFFETLHCSCQPVFKRKPTSAVDNFNGYPTTTTKKQDKLQTFIYLFFWIACYSSGQRKELPVNGLTLIQIFVSKF